MTLSSWSHDNFVRLSAHLHRTNYQSKSPSFNAFAGLSSVAYTYMECQLQCLAHWPIRSPYHTYRRAYRDAKLKEEVMITTIIGVLKLWTKRASRIAFCVKAAAADERLCRKCESSLFKLHDVAPLRSFDWFEQLILRLADSALHLSLLPKSSAPPGHKVESVSECRAVGID